MLSALPRLVRDAFERPRYRWFNQRIRDTSSLNPGTVSFTFDDFPITAAREGSALLEARGWRGTFYLCSGLLGADTEVGKICSLDDVEELYQGGHEIGDHTFSHVGCANAGRATLALEEESSLRALERFGRRRNFAFPFGEYDAAALNFFSGCYDTMRTICAGVNRGVVDLNRLKANPVYESADFGVLERLVEQVRQDGGWVIFYTHDVAPVPSRFGCTPERFQRLLDLVGGASLNVSTVADAYCRLIGGHGSSSLDSPRRVAGS